MNISRLRCESFQNPLGLDAATPQLSWQLQTDRAGAKQIAYHISVSASPDFQELLWDSGRVKSSQTTFVTYEGAPLRSRSRVYWRVEVEDETGATTQSEVANWEMGLLQKSDWQSAWIQAPLAGGPQSSPPVPRLRRAFTVEKPVAQARLYATALGIYEVALNDQKVGDHELAPGWTDYRQRVRYQTYDVTALLQPGENVWTTLLGDGWYCGYISWQMRQTYGEQSRFRGQLEIIYQDGTRETIATDNSWEYAYGPILSADLLMGESHDARVPWKTLGRAETFESPDIELCASLGPPVRATQELAPVRATPIGGQHGLKAGMLFDMGQNMVGRARLRVTGARGTTLRLRYAETLQGGPNVTEGAFYVDNLRSAKQTDYFTLSGGDDVFEPRFTFHGFRFVELLGLGEVSGDVAAPELTGVVLHSDTELQGDFSCSDELVNQLQKNIDWGWRGNSLDLPTDCPQRDERLGWTGDAQVFARTSLFIRDSGAFWREWARSVRDAQSPLGSVPAVVPNSEGGATVTPEHGWAWYDGGPAWADAILICPWAVYRTTGHTRVLEENYESFTRFLDYLQSTSRDNLRCYDGCGYFQGFGDWLALDGSGNTDGNTPKELIGTAFYAHAANLMSQIAQVLGKTDDAARYRALFETVRKTWCARFVTQGGRLSPPYQTPYLLALEFDLLPDELRGHAARELVSEVKARGGKTSSGFVGSPYVNHVLTGSGHLDTAYQLLHQTGWPSWLYAVTQGATTIWERWDGWTQEKGFQDAGMNSFNHYAYGAIGAWLYASVAGIELDPETPGYTRFVLAPKPGGKLTSAKAHLDTLHGRIESEWRIEGGEFGWNYTIPPNTSALVTAPNGETFEKSAGKHWFGCNVSSVFKSSI